MGISRDSRHKHKATGGRKHIHQKKRKFELGRPPALTKVGPKSVHVVRGRGGNLKYRAMRLDGGNFSWGTEGIARRSRIMDVVYNATSNELVRTKTLVKNAIVQIDATAHRQWYEQHYGLSFAKKQAKKDEFEVTDFSKKSTKVQKKFKGRREHRQLDPRLFEQFGTGRLLACVSSRPGQTGRADGYVLEGRELEFYQKKLQKKKGKTTH